MKSVTASARLMTFGLNDLSLSSAELRAILKSAPTSSLLACMQIAFPFTHLWF
jgi:hypothetical protein